MSYIDSKHVSGKGRPTVDRRISSHWRGEQTLTGAAGICLMLVVVPVIAGLSFGAVLLATFPYSVAGTAAFIVNAGALLTVLAGYWWSVGWHAMAMRRLERGHIVRALACFLVSLCGLWCVSAYWVPAWWESVHEDWTQVWHPPELEEKAWGRQPLHVLALPEMGRFSVTGSVGRGSAKAVESAIAAYPGIRLLEIESPGGYVREMDLIVDLLRKHRLDTLVRGKCASACTEIFLAGERRYVGPQARFGFHQSGYAGRSRDTVWSISEYQSSILMREKGVAEEFIHTALNTSYYELWKPHVYDIKTNGFATHWWSERDDDRR